MKNISIAFGFVAGFSTLCFSQPIDSTSVRDYDDPHVQGDGYLSVLIGYNFWNNHFAEFGLAYRQVDSDGHMTPGFNYFLSTEVRIGNEMVLGPKVGIWLSNVFGLGLNLICYTNGTETAWRFRPEYGIGLSRFKLAYGYNISLSNKDFENITRSNISLNVLLDLGKVKDR